MPAGAGPQVFLSRRPFAFRAADTRARGATVPLNHTIRYKGRSICLQAHGYAVIDYNKWMETEMCDAGDMSYYRPNRLPCTFVRGGRQKVRELFAELFEVQ